MTMTRRKILTLASLSPLGLFVGTKLEAKEPDLIRLLRHGEWSSEAYRQCYECWGYCPRCKSAQRRHYDNMLGHRPGCKLADAIESLGGIAERVGVDWSEEECLRQFHMNITPKMQASGKFDGIEVFSPYDY